MGSQRLIPVHEDVPGKRGLVKKIAKEVIRTVLPLGVRKNVAAWIGRQGWIARERRSWWSVELLRDMAEKDINAYHRFLWSRHLSYADTYEVDERFGAGRMNGSRVIFFKALMDFLQDHGMNVDSVFEVGSSLGYQLRFLETELLPEASSFMGIDIDEYSIEAGKKYLRELGSRVQLRCGDMGDMDAFMGGGPWDLTLCTGVLMYLCEEDAAGVVKKMLDHTGKVLAISGLAHPEVDNRELASSQPRARDMSFIHNIDKMVEAWGGTVLWRRWDGAREVDGNTIYFVFAVKDSTLKGGGLQ